MRRTSLGLMVACFATAAFAGDEMMAPYIGNTLTATAPNGVTKVRYKADHTWSSESPQGASRGTWSIKGGDQLCVMQTQPKPPPNAEALCSKVEPHRVGDTWSWLPPGATRPTVLTLTAGH